MSSSTSTSSRFSVLVSSFLAKESTYLSLRWRTWNRFWTKICKFYSVFTFKPPPSYFHTQVSFILYPVNQKHHYWNTEKFYCFNDPTLLISDQFDESDSVRDSNLGSRWFLVLTVTPPNGSWSTFLCPGSPSLAMDWWPRLLDQHNPT